jgi:hypothetical protein
METFHSVAAQHPTVKAHLLVASALRSRLVRVVQLPARAVSTLPVQRWIQNPALSIVLSLLAAAGVVAQTAASGSATGFNDLGSAGIGSGASQGPQLEPLMDAWQKQ